jgi:hypothetical protein
MLASFMYSSSSRVRRSRSPCVPSPVPLLFETYRRAWVTRFPRMAVFLVGNDRLELLGGVDVGVTRLDPGDDRRARRCLPVRKQSARSPAEADDGRSDSTARSGVPAGQTTIAGTDRR